MAAAQLASMLLELRHRCPKLCPMVVPAGYSDGFRGSSLIALCQNQEQQQKLTSMLAHKRAKAGGRCALTQTKVASDELRFVSIWETDPERRELRLRRGVFVCAQVIELLQPSLFLESFTRVEPDCEKLTELALLFCQVNGQEDRRKNSTDARAWLQECVNLAYACEVLASSLGPWQVVGPNRAPLSSDPIECAEVLFTQGSGEEIAALPSSPKLGKPNVKRATSSIKKKKHLH